MEGLLSLFFVRLSWVFSLSVAHYLEKRWRGWGLDLGTLLWVRAVGASAHSLQCGCALHCTGLVSVSLSVEGSPSMFDLFIV